jgi:hypothetical protein
MIAFQEKLDKILERVISDDLLGNKGLGNEIGFYIFDYPAEYEMVMREHIDFLRKYIPNKMPDLRFSHIHLFELIVDYLKGRNLFDRAIDIQQKKGNEQLFSALKGPLSADKIAREFVQKARPDENDLVLVSGVGSAYPLLRSHNLLNNLHSLMGDTPLVMFYPGVYTGQGLKLFGKMKEINYYRAFQLVPQ